MDTKWTRAGSGGSMTIEGSADGVNWFPIRGAPGSASGRALQAMIEQEDAEHAERTRPPSDIEWARYLRMLRSLGLSDLADALSWK